MVRFLKQRLSIAERASGDGRWVTHLPGILRDYNQSKIKGTNVRRSDVSQDNYLNLLGQLRHTSEPSLLFNMSEAHNAPSGLSRFLWRYSVGDRVLLARRVDYAIRGKNYFEKPSVAGTFGPRVYTITACRTKLNSEYFLCPVYGLTSDETGPLSGWYYQEEVSPALFDRPRASPQQQTAPAGRKKRQRRRT